VTDPLNLAHRIHVSLIAGGYTARCTCGWVVTRATREQRQTDIDEHHAVPHTHGTHGFVPEGD
jgi:hypothetical protein